MKKAVLQTVTILLIVISLPSCSQPKSAEYYYKSGMDKIKIKDKTMKINDFPEILEDFSKAIEINPKFSEAYIKRADSYSALASLFAMEMKVDYDTKMLEVCKNNENAIIDYSKAIELNPKDEESFLSRAYLYSLRKPETGTFLLNDEKVIEDYSKVIELNPKNEHAYYLRGLRYMEMLYIAKAYEKALADFSKALELNPKYKLAYHYRGRCYYELREIKDACKDWEKAADLGDEEAKKDIAKYCN